MPTEATIKEANGATPTWTAITNARFCVADVAVPGLNYPVPIPTSGFRYSFWKTLCLEFSGIGTYVGNIRFFTDGDVGWNVGIGGRMTVGSKDSGDSGLPIESYAQATGEEGTSGNYMGDSQNGHPTYKGAGYTIKNAEDCIVGSPLVVDSTQITEDGKSKAIVLQVKVDTLANGAIQGAQVSETLYLRYDEI
jgi:hypothetical protein